MCLNRTRSATYMHENSFLKKLAANLKKSHLNKPQIIANTVIECVNAGAFALGEPVPSIQKTAGYCKIAKETIRQAYNILKSKGVLGSKRGRSYYVITEHYAGKPNVFLMFNYFGTPHKVETLKGILAGVGDNVTLSLFSHYKDPDIFVKTLEEAKGKYDYYVVMPLRDKKCAEALSKFDQSKLLLIDIDIDFPGKACPKIIQNFDENFLEILRSLSAEIKKYDGFTPTLVLNNAPAEHKNAFREFLKEAHLSGKIMERPLKSGDVEKGRIWFVFDDADLVTAVKTSEDNGFKIGRDYAIVSYNFVPMKSIVCGGLTTITIDFFGLGMRIAKQLLNWNPACSETVETFLVRGKTL